MTLFHDSYLTETFHQLNSAEVAMIEKDPNGKSPNEPGAKLDHGKTKAGLLSDFSLALLAVAEVGTFGANKYSRGGWQHVDNGTERYTDAMWRHLLKERHEPKDQDSELLHSAHAAWNALARLELVLREQASEDAKPEWYPEQMHYE